MKARFKFNGWMVRFGMIRHITGKSGTHSIVMGVKIPRSVGRWLLGA